MRLTIGTHDSQTKWNPHIKYDLIIIYLSTEMQISIFSQLRTLRSYIKGERYRKTESGCNKYGSSFQLDSVLACRVCLWIILTFYQNFYLNVFQNSELVVNRRVSISLLSDKHTWKKEEKSECFILELAQYDQKHGDCRPSATIQSNIFLIFSFSKPENSKGRKSIECALHTHSFYGFH